MSLGSKKGCMWFTFAVHRQPVPEHLLLQQRPKRGRYSLFLLQVSDWSFGIHDSILDLKLERVMQKPNNSLKLMVNVVAVEVRIQCWHGSTCPHSFEALQEVFVMANKKGNYFWENLMLQYDFPSTIHLEGSFCFLTLWDFTGLRR